MSAQLSRWPWVILPAAVALYCTTPDTMPTPAAAPTATGGTGSTSGSGGASATASGTGTGGSATCPPPKAPGVPDGWTDYLDWQCNACRLYVPISKALLPPPIVWEKCAASLGPADCQQMKVDWSASTLAVGRGIFTMSANGPLIGFARGGTDNSLPYYLVAEPDGAVHSAIMLAAPTPGCIFDQYALHDDRVIYTIDGDKPSGDWSTSVHRGALGASVDELHPSVLGDFGEDSSWACSSSRVYRWAQGLEVYAYDWKMQGKTFITSPAVDPEGLQPHQPVTWNDDFFWTSSSLFQSGINSWTAVDGARPFIRYVGDATRGAGDLGTDGVNLVWSYAEGKKPDEWNSKFPIRSIMTSPYTTDPTKLVPKRLRSDPSGSINGQPFRVACGRAAHGGKIFPAVVVRISDGVSWIVPTPPSPDYYSDVIGLTCDHVYVEGYFGGRYNIARIRLDSLGPGTPPD